MTLPAPVPVSPLIRVSIPSPSTLWIFAQHVFVSTALQFSRYAFLSLGIMYGFSRDRRLAVSERQLREEEAKVMAVRNVQLAIERAKAAEDERAAIAILSR